MGRLFARRTNPVRMEPSVLVKEMAPGTYYSRCDSCSWSTLLRGERRWLISLRPQRALRDHAVLRDAAVRIALSHLLGRHPGLSEVRS